MKPYGWIGLCIIVIAELMLHRGSSIVGVWMTPLIWTGYILFLDNIVLKHTGTSLISKSRGQLPGIALLSIASWLIFEGYNVYLHNWHYVNLPDRIWVRYTGYAWAFATITPGIFETADLLWSFGVFASSRTRSFTLSLRLVLVLVAVGAVMSFYPLLSPDEYLFPPVWVGYILLIDPLNYMLGGRSLLAGLAGGKPGRIYRLLLAGAVCGVLWEFWNYWAYTKWEYTVPYFPEVKLFEMPVAGYLGFPPFALECYVLYQFFRVMLDKVGVTLRYV